MPVQRTFTVIPAAAGPTKPAPQPMTSKQVRKAYQAATRSAPVPRASRIRQERAEQDRIRRELDRERSVARARAARQRRRDREAAVREDRRRGGLPLALVRPGQHSIAGFVRGGAVVGALRSVGEVDLIPDEDGLDLEALDAVVHGQSCESGPAQKESSRVASAHSSHSQPRPAPPSPDTSLHEFMPDTTPPPAPQKHAPVPAATEGPPPRAAAPPPPAATQAILSDLSAFFPSSSQQERELREETAAADGRAPSPDPPPPRRFFTPTGDGELVTLALQRSRRGAALEATQRRQPAAAARAAAARDCPPRPAKAARSCPSPPSCRPPEPDKENVAPTAGVGADADDGLPASQETEYGGDWVDEIAVEFTI